MTHIGQFLLRNFHKMVNIDSAFSSTFSVMWRHSLTLYCKLVYICVFDCVCLKYVPTPSPLEAPQATFESDLSYVLFLCVFQICTCVCLLCFCLHHIRSHRPGYPRCSRHLACNLISDLLVTHTYTNLCSIARLFQSHQLVLKAC